MTSHANPAIFPPGAYWQEDWLEKEKAGVFTHHWVFAGLAEDVARPNDYLSFTVAGLPVVIRNMKDKLVAFRNICAHRYSIIHPEGCGNAMFRCPFHGWTYDADGVPIGIPDNENSFGFDKDERCKYALDAVAVDKIGHFLFVRLASHGVSLREYLGSVADDLEHISQMFGQTYARLDQTWQCNWKIGLEITLEGYHMPLVHAATFDEHIGGTRPAAGDEELLTPDQVAASAASSSPPADNADEGSTTYIGPHSINSAPLSMNSKTHLDTVAKRLRLPQSTRMTGYDHFLLCPNVMIGVNGGTNVCIERYEPISPNTTRVQCWLMTGTPSDQKLRDGIIWQTITKQWAEWTTSVLAEDRTACEAAQRGARHAGYRAILGRCEDRVLGYQKALSVEFAAEVKAA